MKASVYLLSVILLAGGCANAGETTTASGGDDPQAAIEAAIQAQKKAASVGHEWRDTQKLIDEAKEAAKKGDSAEAIKKANKAKKQGEMAYQQSEDQKNAAPHY
jgi:hypothetical protein